MKPLLTIAFLLFGLTAAGADAPERTVNVENRTYTVRFPSDYEFVKTSIEKKTKYWKFASQNHGLLVFESPAEGADLASMLKTGGYRLDIAEFFVNRSVAVVDVSAHHKGGTWQIYSLAKCGDQKRFFGIWLTTEEDDDLVETTKASLLRDFKNGGLCEAKPQTLAETGPRVLHTKGYNGTVYVTGTFTRTADGAWEERNTQNRNAVITFRVLESDKKRLLLFDRSRNLYLSVDLVQRRLSWRSGSSARWNPFYDIERIEY